MWKVAIILCVLLAAAIPLSQLDSSLATGVAGIMAACCLLAAVIAIRPGEMAFLGSIIGPYLAVSVIPAAWMLLQIIPFAWLAHPVWRSASESLGQPITGSITIDTGATLQAILTYLAGLATCLASTAVAIDPRRARLLANVVVTITATLAVIVAIQFRLSGLTTLSTADASAKLGGTIGAVLIGIPLCLASALDAWEVRNLSSAALSRPAIRSAMCAVGALAGMASVWACSTGSTAVLAAAAIGSVLIIYTSRRLGLPLWGSAAISGTLVIILLGVALTSRADPTLPGVVAFSTASNGQIQATRHMLEGLPWAGVGAGAASALLPTYAELESSTLTPVTASIAATAITELGPILCWLILLAAAFGISSFFAGALDRGRDWSFSTSAAAALVAFVASAFVLPGVSSLATVLLLAVVLGMGIAQRVSRART